jgi:hypothetical protein
MTLAILVQFTIAATLANVFGALILDVLRPVVLAALARRSLLSAPAISKRVRKPRAPKPPPVMQGDLLPTGGAAAEAVKS